MENPLYNKFSTHQPVEAAAEKRIVERITVREYLRILEYIGPE